MVTRQRLVSVFLGLADTLVADFDVIDFLDTLTRTSVEVLGVDAAGLMLADQRGHLQVVAASTEELRLLELLELQNDQGPCLDCYREGQPVVNVPPDEARKRWPVFHSAVEAQRFRSVHAVPLRLRSEVIGAINLFVVSPEPLTGDDIALGQGLADMATIGLLQERAVHEHVILAEQLQGALNSRVLIEQAKGMLAERHGLDPADAFTLMRTYARRSGSPLLAIAQRVVEGDAHPAGLTHG
jgi:GAF domain-containing protein